jgi:hypothetical protein
LIVCHLTQDGCPALVRAIVESEQRRTQRGEVWAGVELDGGEQIVCELAGGEAARIEREVMVDARLTGVGLARGVRLLLTNNLETEEIYSCDKGESRKMFFTTVARNERIEG